MNFKSRIGIVAGTAMLLAVGMSAGQFASAAEPRSPSGNLDLRLNGYEVVTPQSSTTPSRLSIDGIGQLIGDTTAGGLHRNRQRSDHSTRGSVWLGRRPVHHQPGLCADQPRCLLHPGNHQPAV